MNHKISVITCSHNPRPAYLARTLSGLRKQSLPQSEWQYILIDNCSDRPLAEIEDLTWHSQGRHVREEELGLTHARLRGIREATGELLIFVDDDNVLDPDYLELALGISFEYPSLGAWSGQCKGEFEVPPPEWSKRYLSPLCVGEFERDYWCNFPFPSPALPSGAGLCIRAEVAHAYARLHESGARPIALDRAGNSLVSGGDVDMDLTCADLGLGMGIFQRLRLTHLIPAFRLEEDYLVKLAEAMAFSSVVLEHYRPSPNGPGPLGFRTRVADLLRMVLMTRRERRFFRAVRLGLTSGRKTVSEMRANASRDIQWNGESATAP